MNLTQRLLPTPRRPFAPFETLREEMDRLLDTWSSGIDGSAMLSATSGNGAWFHPQLDVVESKKGLAVTAEIPGVDEKNIEIELTPDHLIIRGTKEESSEDKDETSYRRERRFGSFQRQIQLPWQVDTSAVQAKASFKEGVLKVEVPKPKKVAALSKKVEIDS